MAKTYTSAGTVAAGDVATAAAWNVVTADVNNLIVPASCSVVRTTSLTGYTSDADITWTTTAAYDTDSMFSSGAPTRITINTAGLYLVTSYVLLQATPTLTSVTLDTAKNGTLISRVVPYYSSSAAYISGAFVLNLAAADYLTFRHNIVGGSAYIVTGNATEGVSQSRVNVTWIGRTS